MYIYFFAIYHAYRRDKEIQRIATAFSRDFILRNDVRKRRTRLITTRFAIIGLYYAIKKEDASRVI